MYVQLLWAWSTNSEAEKTTKCAPLLSGEQFHAPLAQGVAAGSWSQLPPMNASSPTLSAAFHHIIQRQRRELTTFTISANSSSIAAPTWCKRSKYENVHVKKQQHSYNKKSPANAKGNAQQQCMFESHSHQRVPDDQQLIIYSALLVLTRGHNLQGFSQTWIFRMSWLPRLSKLKHLDVRIQNLEVMQSKTQAQY